MIIYFVRHGKTEHNINRLATGHIDVPLLEEGLKEAEKLTSEIPNDFTEIYSSDLLRCKQTAEILNSKLGLKIVYDPRLRERDFGSLAGQPIETFSLDLREKDKNQKYDYRPYGGESVEDVKTRVFSFIEDLIKNKQNEKILVVTSGGVIRLLHNLINKEVHEKIHNASIHEFEFTIQV